MNERSPHLNRNLVTDLQPAYVDRPTPRQADGSPSPWSAAVETPAIGIRTEIIDLSIARSQDNPLLLNIQGNAMRVSLVLDNAGAITTAGYAFLQLNQDDGFNPVTLFHTIHGNKIKDAKLWNPAQAGLKMYISYWTDSRDNPLEMQRG